MRRFCFIVLRSLHPFSSTPLNAILVFMDYNQNLHLTHKFIFLVSEFTSDHFYFRIRTSDPTPLRFEPMNSNLEYVWLSHFNFEFIKILNTPPVWFWTLRTFNFELILVLTWIQIICIHEDHKGMRAQYWIIISVNGRPRGGLPQICATPIFWWQKSLHLIFKNYLSPSPLKDQHK